MMHGAECFPDGPLNGTFTAIPTRRKQTGGHPVTKVLCSQAPPPHITRPGVAPGVQSLGPPRGKLNCFCPWDAVFGASAGQIERFLLQSLPKKMQNNRVFALSPLLSTIVPPAPIKVMMQKTVGDGRREEGHFPEPTAASSRSHRAW